MVREALTPLRAIREKCLWCCVGSKAEVKLCPVTSCALWPLRLGRGVRGSGLSPTRAITSKCLDCGGGASIDGKFKGSTQAVQACGCLLVEGPCPLWPWRTPSARRQTRAQAKNAQEAAQALATAHFKDKGHQIDQGSGSRPSAMKCAQAGGVGKQAATVKSGSSGAGG